MGSFYMEATQINYRRDETLKTVDQKLQELSETSAIDTDIAPVFKSTNTYAPGDMVYYRNKLYVFNVEHTGAWAAGDVSATDVTTEISSLKSGLTNYERDNNWRIEAPERKNHYDSNSDRLMYDTSHAWWLDSSVNKIASGGNTNYTWAVKCYPNTTYTVSLTHTSTTFRVAYGKMANLTWVTTDDTPKDIYGLQSNSETGDVSITITTGADATYLFIQIGSSDVDTAKLTMQVELGDTKTAYTPYIPSVESRIEAVESSKSTAITTKSAVSSDIAFFQNAAYQTYGKVVTVKFDIKMTTAYNTYTEISENAMPLPLAGTDVKSSVVPEGETGTPLVIKIDKTTGKLFVGKGEVNKVYVCNLAYISV